ncbi:MAG: hypothetical protein K5657_05550 [Desulfovibrio sp.]|nr:hypothetical protein [Desulfovibrio sp.]
MAGKKKVLLTMLEDNEGLAKLLSKELSASGLQVAAHVWQHDLSAMCFGEVAKELATSQAWVIAGGDFSKRETRIGLSLAALAVQNTCGQGFPILLSPSSQAPEADSLPTPLKDALCVKKGLGAKAAVLASTAKLSKTDYRIVPHALGRLGLWFEIGPEKDAWQGAFFASGARATDKAVPSAHGVGVAGTIPEKSTLHYPVMGVKLSWQDVALEGAGVRNELSCGTSYYVRVQDFPDVVSFGPFPDGDEAWLYTLMLS